MAVITQSVYL